MSKQRKQYTATFKAQIVQEVLAEERTIGQIAAGHGIHPNMIRKWKTAALTAMPAAFDEEGAAKRQLAALQGEHEREKEQLYAEIGRLTTQVNWLQKKIAAGSASMGTARPGRSARQ
jgi:transposase-like protein